MKLSPKIASLALALTAFACSAEPPVPLVVLENPTTHQRANFYREIPFKVPANYDETKHIAQWKADQIAKGFTVVIKDKP